MSIKAFAAKILAKKVYTQTQKWVKNPIETQQKVFEELIREAAQTQFGKDHDFSTIKTFSDFAQKVPVRDYEGLKHCVDRVVKGEENVQEQKVRRPYH